MNNNNDNRRIAKNTIFLYLRMLLIMVVSLYTSRIILQALGVQDFGIYNVVGGVVAMFSMISSSLTAAISRFFTYELGKNNFEHLSQIFSSSLFTQVALVLLLFICMETFGLWFVNYKMNIPIERLLAANWVLQCSIISFSIGIISASYNAVIIAYERMDAFAYIGIIEAILKLLVAMVLLYGGSADLLVLYSILQLIVSVAIGLSYIIFGIKKLPGCAVYPKFNLNMFKKIFGYTTWSVFGSLSYAGYNYGYNILLNLFFDPAVNAARGVAVQVQNAVYSFANNFQASLNPQIIKNYAVRNIDRMHQLIFTSSKFSFFMMLLLSLPLTLEADYLLNVWLVEVPPHAVNFVRLILITITFECLAGPMICSNNATGKIKWFQILTNSVFLLSVPVCYLILSIGCLPESIYIIYIASFFISQSIRYIIVFPSISMKMSVYFRSVIARVIVVSIIAIPVPVFLCILIPKSFFSFVVVSLTAMCMVIISVFFFGMTINERKFALSKIKGLKCHM